MTQSEVIKAEKTVPLRRTQMALVYRDEAFGIPAQLLFEFTDGKLDDISYVADSPPQNLELTKRYGRGVFEKYQAGSSRLSIMRRLAKRAPPSRAYKPSPQSSALRLCRPPLHYALSTSFRGFGIILGRKS